MDIADWPLVRDAEPRCEIWLLVQLSSSALGSISVSALSPDGRPLRLRELGRMCRRGLLSPCRVCRARLRRCSGDGPAEGLGHSLLSVLSLCLLHTLVHTEVCLSLPPPCLESGPVRAFQQLFCLGGGVAAILRGLGVPGGERGGGD